MATLTQLRLPEEDEFSWYALARVVDRPLGCSGCNRRIHPGTEHARGEDDGRRICPRCVESAEVGESMSATDANRRARDKKREAASRYADRMIRMLLDGLEVGSIQELKRLVDAARPSAERRFMADRGGLQSQAIGLARLAHDGTAEGAERAKRYLDDVCVQLQRLHFDACVEDGYPLEAVERFLGPRDKTLETP